jgi:hypothetical protein
MSSDEFPATPTTSGWYPLDDGSGQETYWDGSAWTKRRQYRFGAPFVELPLHPSDPPLAPEPPPPTASAPAPTSPLSTPSAVPPWRTDPLAGSSSSRASVSPATASSSTFQSSRRRIRFVQLMYLIAFIGFFAFRGHTGGVNPQKYFAILFVVGLIVGLILRMSSARARQEVRAQESDRRPRWPFRYMSRLTEGLQGPRLTSFVGGMRTQPRFRPEGLNATVPLARLSIFSNGIRVGPSSSLLSMSVPTWEARFDELDVIQAIGRVQGLTTGILFRKSQSHEWVIFWSTNRDSAFAALENMGVAVSREPVHLRVGSQWRVNQFAEDELRPSEPSVLSSASATRAVGSSGATSPLTFPTSSSTISNVTTTAPEDRKWPGIVVLVVVVLIVASITALVSNLIPNSAVPGAPNSGVVTTTTTTVSVGTITPTEWRTSEADNAHDLSLPLAGLSEWILHLRYYHGSSATNYNLIDLTSGLQIVNSECNAFRNLATDGPPSPALASGAANVGAACGELVSVDRADLKSSNNEWTPRLASNNQHWLKLLENRLAVLHSGASN